MDKQLISIFIIIVTVAIIELFVCSPTRKNVRNKYSSLVKDFDFTTITAQIFLLLGVMFFFHLKNGDLYTDEFVIKGGFLVIMTLLIKKLRKI